ncbi:Rhodanese-like protein [Coniochaeta ligniaria NRRL 30616]|uniref:Rhodanese-like protein n=1 Tax=Coniochaeta ligniaria NRRL 30616 TaxID=1408157 RepID=A0A1J7JFN5_9PEZI|nr:Rhodanese-like protein [Coniochaeta ligniaria NRRL 30616]
MASRRTVTQVLRAASRIHLQQPVATVRHRSTIVQQSPFLTKPSSSQLLLRTTVRAYSQASQESKIWSFEEIQKLSQEAKPSVTIIDVREPGELQQTGHIPHAINIPINSAPDSFHITPEEFEDRFGFPRPAKDADVVFYCKAGVRSRGAAGIARDAGYTKVGEYPGSWLDWFEKNGKVER